MNAKNEKYIKRSEFDTSIHGRNGGTYWNFRDKGFIYDNVTLLCMSCNGQVIYNGQKNGYTLLN